MHIKHQVVVFDAADLAAESSFWAGVLDGTVDAEDDRHMVMVGGEPRVGVQLAPNHVPPDWPDGTPEQQIHLDLWVEDFGAAHDRVMSLGAKVLKAAGDVDAVDNFQVYADPAGHRQAGPPLTSVQATPPPSHFHGVRVADPAMPAKPCAVRPARRGPLPGVTGVAQGNDPTLRLAPDRAPEPLPG